MVIEQDSIEEATISLTETVIQSRIQSGDRAASDMLRYLLAMLGVMGVMYAAPFVLVRSGVYDRINPSVFARPLNYPFTTAGQNADVVLFGDSTALMGIDPSQMSSALGVKVINLVNTQPSLVVNDDLTLRRYLASNRPPKLIVLYFAPWDFDYGHTDFDARPTYEGEELLVRQGARGQLLTFARKHPEHAVLFPLRFYATAWQLTLHRVPHSSQDAQLSSTGGHIDNMDKTVLPASCTFPPLLLNNIRFDWVHSLGAKYASPQTKVLFYVAPVPTCANVASILNRPYSDLPAAAPEQVPARFFSNDIRYVHPLPFAVPQLTGNLIEAVRPLLGVGHTATPSSSRVLP